VETPPPEAIAPAAPSPPPAPAPVQASAAAPADHIVNIREARCGDLLKLAPDDRAAATMFYIGYQASRFRARTVNVALIPSIEAQALTNCEENGVCRGLSSNPRITARTCHLIGHLKALRSGGSDGVWGKFSSVHPWSLASIRSGLRRPSLR